MECIVFSDIHVWDMVSELVGLCTMPPPDNPFSLDTRYLQTLPLPDRFLVTGALLNFLEVLVVQGRQEEVYYDMGESEAHLSQSNQTSSLEWCLSPVTEGGLIIPNMLKLFPLGLATISSGKGIIH